MKPRDLLKLGFKPGPAIGAALLLIPKAEKGLGHEAMLRSVGIDDVAHSFEELTRLVELAQASR